MYKDCEELLKRLANDFKIDKIAFDYKTNKIEITKENHTFDFLCLLDAIEHFEKAQ